VVLEVRTLDEEVRELEVEVLRLLEVEEERVLLEEEERVEEEEEAGKEEEEGVETVPPVLQWLALIEPLST